MYALSNESGRPRPQREEEDDTDDHKPRVPERQATLEKNTKAPTTSFAAYHNQDQSMEQKASGTQDTDSSTGKRRGGGAAAATRASRTKIASQRNSDYVSDDDEGPNEAGEKNRKPKAGETTVGAVAVPGMTSSGETRSFHSPNNQDTYSHQDSFINRSPPAGTNGSLTRQNEPVVARCVADDEADIEAQVQSRMNAEARDIAEMVHKQIIASAAVAEIQPSVQDMSSKSTQDQDEQTLQKQKQKRLCIIAIAVLAVLAAIGAVVGVAVSNKSNSSTGAPTTTSTQELCSFCHDGSTPPNLDTNEALGQTCVAFRESHILLDSTDSNCVLGQSIAYAYCECPTLPPRPDNPKCTVCKSGAVPSGSGCNEVDTLVQHLGSYPLFTCEDLVASAYDNDCTCPGEEPPPPVDKCSFCYDGTTPTSLILETNEVLGQTCGEYREKQIQLASTDLDCIIGQTVAAGLCGCPTYPPRPENPTCTLCENGAEPIGGTSCEAIETVIQQLGEDPDNSCADLRDAAGGTSCTCP